MERSLYHLNSRELRHKTYAVDSSSDSDSDHGLPLGGGLSSSPALPRSELALSHGTVVPNEKSPAINDLTSSFSAWTVKTFRSADGKPGLSEYSNERNMSRKDQPRLPEGTGDAAPSGFQFQTSNTSHPSSAQPAPTLPPKKKMDFSRGFTKEFNDEIERQMADMYGRGDGESTPSTIGSQKRETPRAVKNDENVPPASMGQYKVEKESRGQQSGTRGPLGNVQYTPKYSDWSANNNTSSSSNAHPTYHHTANSSEHPLARSSRQPISSNYTSFASGDDPKSDLVDAFGVAITPVPSRPSGSQGSNSHQHSAPINTSRPKRNKMDFSRGFTQEEEEKFQKYRAEVYGDDKGERQG